ncbi:MAG: DUF3352 domain-containing protein [Timaviella obliquedivisa GSE-PSE-MK23-08B]|jgi:hypothetical protein|nr:DUF3352 domain-containing protein [Timaviella obliquedivisa GSE-PSE-MK23-08B]
MKSRSFFSALALAVIILLGVGAGGAYWLASSSPLGGKISSPGMPSAAIFMSRRSPIVASFFGNPDRLISGGLVFTPPTQRRAMQTEFKQFQNSLLADTHLNYSHDIQPWAGDEMTWAWTATDLDRDSDNGQQPGYLVAIATDKPEQAQESLERFWQKRVAKGADLVAEQYLGVPIVYGAESLASAVVGDRFVLFANHPKVLRDALNNAQVPELNLSNSKVYQQITTNLPAESLGLMVINLPQLATVGGNSLPLNPLYDCLVMTAKLAPQGLLADATLLSTTGTTAETTITQPALSAPVDALKFIPKGLVTAAGTNVKQVLAQFETDLVGYETIAKLLQQPIAKLEKQWNISLSEDVLSWMPGEYALGMLPRSEGTNDWIFVTRQSAETTEGLKRLNAIAQTQGISLGSVPLGETKITAWTTLQTVPKPRANSPKNAASKLMTIQAKVEGVHASVNGYEIFATSLEAMEQAIQAAQAPVAEDRQRAIAALAPRNNGYLFLDEGALQMWGRSFADISEHSPQDISKKVQILLDHVASATLSNYGSDAQGQHNGVFVQLKR